MCSPNNIDIALGISVTLVMTLVSRISPELFLRLHLLKIIFYLRVQLSNTCIICTVFNMYVKIFNYKSQNWAWPSTFFKMYVKGTYLNEIGRLPLSTLKNLHLCFQSILFTNAFLCRASRCYWRTSEETGRYSSIARTTSHSKCARYEFAILNLTRTKSGLFRFLDSIPRVGYLQFKPIPTIKSVHHVIVNQTSTN